MLELLRGIARLEKALWANAPAGFFTTDLLGFQMDDVLLQKLIIEMACFIKLPYYSIKVVVDGLQDTVAGNISGADAWTHHVTISIKSDMLHDTTQVIKVLAHEISHKYLAFHGLELADKYENERLTDIASIYLGFGKFVLNGISYRVAKGEMFTGYLCGEKYAFAYDYVCHMRGVPECDITEGLNKRSRQELKSARKRLKEYYPRRDGKDIEVIKRDGDSAFRKIEKVELALCNVKKIAYFDASRIDECVMDKIREFDRSIVKCRETLSVIEAESKDFLRKRIYPLIPIWRKEIAGVHSKIAELSLAVKRLNAYVQKKSRKPVCPEAWKDLGVMIIECPKCRGGMRVPTMRGHIGVRCPRCNYSFDYSTDPPECRSSILRFFPERIKPVVARLTLREFPSRR